MKIVPLVPRAVLRLRRTPSIGHCVIDIASLRYWFSSHEATPVGLSRECLVQDALKSCPASAPFACVRVGKRKYWAQAMSRAGRREGGPARALRTSASDAIADEMNDVGEVAQDLIY